MNLEKLNKTRRDAFIKSRFVSAATLTAKRQKIKNKEIKGLNLIMKTNENYTKINSETIDKWVSEGWEWGEPVTPEIFCHAKKGDWQILLTPTKPVPKHWFPTLKGAKVLGLASGGGQQIPVFCAQGADCTVLDYSAAQLESELMVARRENYRVKVIRADMTKPLPFGDGEFDMIFHPVSNCYVKDVIPIWKECFRVLKKGGVLLAGLDNGINYLFDDDETALVHKLPFDPLSDRELYEKSLASDWGIQFSHTVEEQIGGQLQAGFTLTDIYHDTNGSGRLHELNAPTYYATRAVK